MGLERKFSNDGRSISSISLAAAIAGIEIFLKERAKINFFEGIFLFFRGNRVFFGRDPFAIFFLAGGVIEQGNGVFQLLQNRILHHLGGDHVAQLKLVEREHADHLHEARREDLPLRDFQMELGLE